MLLTTTPTIVGKEISEYCGVVTGETIIGANVFRDIFASITDIVGGRSGAYEQALNEARQLAMQDMENAAKSVGADAVIAIDIDYENMNNMLMVSVSGTAVKLKV
jgi:uncharacterized protein YbjQ (UPF0145 family)